MQLTSPKWFESGGARPCPIGKRLASFIRMSSWGLFLTLLTVHGHGKEPADRRPNLLLILADDMGYSDLSSYGGEIGTPNIDSLAREGLLFTQFYNNAKCAPTRASLLTGLYHHQSGIHRSRVRNDSGATIAELLQQAGYRTMMVGNPMMTGTWYHPEQSSARGFDRHFGFSFRRSEPGLSESHLNNLLSEYIEQYYHCDRPHQGLDGGTPDTTTKPDVVDGPIKLLSFSICGGLHHRYERVAA